MRANARLVHPLLATAFAVVVCGVLATRGSWSVLWLALPIGLGIWLGRELRVAVSLDAKGMTIVNPVRTHRVEWTSVTELGTGTTTLLLSNSHLFSIIRVRAGGHWIPIAATAAATPDELSDLLWALERLSDAYGFTLSIDARDFPSPSFLSHKPEATSNEQLIELRDRRVRIAREIAALPIRPPAEHP